MKRIFTIILLSFLFCFCVLGEDFGSALKNDANSLWILSPEKFKTTFGSPEIYKWKNALKNVLNYRYKESEKQLFFFEHPIDKADFRFKSKQLQGMYLTFARPNQISDKETYLKYSLDLKGKITRLGEFGNPKMRKRRTRSGYRYTYSWVCPEYYISLKSNYSTNSKNNFKPGKIKFSIFRRFTIKALDKKDDTAPALEASTKKKVNPNIKTNDKGDCYLTVKMTKEDSPKDCLFASVKRIFDYYKTSPKDRSWEKIKKNLELNVKSAKGLKRVFASVIGECRCDVKKMAVTRDFDDFNSVIGFLRDYNMQAAKMGKNKIDSFKINSFNKLIAVMEEDVLIKTRDNPKKIEAFKSKVCKEIDAAKPVMWVVFIGVVKEKPEPLVTGGHVRLIVGYNSKTNEVIYSDNWGPGHELKKMTWDKAWAMTLSALAVTVKK